MALLFCIPVGAIGYNNDAKIYILRYPFLLPVEGCARSRANLTQNAKSEGEINCKLVNKNYRYEEINNSFFDFASLFFRFLRCQKI